MTLNEMINNDETPRPPVKFGTDGIRGVAGQYPLDSITVIRIGRAIGQWLRSHSTQSTFKLLVGQDTRESSISIAIALAGGITVEGGDTTLYGVTTTPQMAHEARRQKLPAIMITASHNPYEQNGIKMFGADGFKLTDEQEAEIERYITTIPDELINNPPLSGSGVSGQSSLPPPDDLTEYAAFLLKEPLAQQFGIRPLKGLIVVLECAHGSASRIAPSIFREAGAFVFILNANPTGKNINLKAGSEYVRRDRSGLLNTIRANNADLGIAFDGDADRVVFVTPDGLLIDGDHTLGILAVQMQAEGRLPHATVVATDMSNSGLEHFLRDQGIQLERTKVGDRYVMERMRSGGFALGGEQAGHVIILDDDHTAGDGLYVGLLIGALAADHKRTGGATLSELAARIPRYPQVIASAHLARQVDLATVTGLAALEAETLNAFEGQGRVNLRFSGTEPNLLRAMVEGGSRTSITEVVQRALALCRIVATVADTPDPRVDVVDCVTGAPVSVA